MAMRPARLAAVAGAAAAVMVMVMAAGFGCWPPEVKEEAVVMRTTG
jgi:hypothetical protein